MITCCPRHMIDPDKAFAAHAARTCFTARRDAACTGVVPVGVPLAAKRCIT